MPNGEVNFYQSLFHVKLSQRQKVILEWMVQEPVDTGALARMLDDSSLSRARVFVSQLRRKLEGTGWTIANTVRGGHEPGFYKLVRE